MSAAKAILAKDVPVRTKKSIYPAPFAALMQGREKRQLGELFGLTNFGVNQSSLAPGAVSALRHWHSKQDEFIYILAGSPILLTNAGEQQLQPGSCAGFKAGISDGHQLINRSNEWVIYLEVGDRTADDQVTYPDNDLAARLEQGNWRFYHKNGAPYNET